jgi:hypothetical protein
VILTGALLGLFAVGMTVQRFGDGVRILREIARPASTKDFMAVSSE